MLDEGRKGKKKIPMQKQVRNRGMQFLDAYFVRCAADMISPNGVVIRIELQIGLSDCNTLGTQISGAYSIT